MLPAQGVALQRRRTAHGALGAAVRLRRHLAVALAFRADEDVDAAQVGGPGVGALGTGHPSRVPRRRGVAGSAPDTGARRLPVGPGRLPHRPTASLVPPGGCYDASRAPPPTSRSIDSPPGSGGHRASPCAASQRSAWTSPNVSGALTPLATVRMPRARARSTIRASTSASAESWATSDTSEGWILTSLTGRDRS